MSRWKGLKAIKLFKIGMGVVKMIPFTKTSITDVEKKFMNDALINSKICGDGVYTKNVMNGLKKIVE